MAGKRRAKRPPKGQLSTRERLKSQMRWLYPRGLMVPPPGNAFRASCDVHYPEFNGLLSRIIPKMDRLPIELVEKFAAREEVERIDFMLNMLAVDSLVHVKGVLPRTPAEMREAEDYLPTLTYALFLGAWLGQLGMITIESREQNAHGQRR